MVSPSVSQHVDVRPWEWAFSVPLVMLGVSILIWPKIAHGSILEVLVENIGPVLCAIAFTVTGLVGIAALIANGQSRRIGPRLRVLSAIVRSVLWLTFVLSMARVSYIQRFPSPMIFFWSSFAATEIFIAYRAAVDVRPRTI